MEESIVSKEIPGLFQSSALYVLGDALSRGVTFLLLPLLANYLSAEEFGIIALATTLVNFLSLLLSFRGVVNRFYYQYPPEKRLQVLGSFWIFLLLLSNFVLLVVGLFGDNLVSCLLPSLTFFPYVIFVLLIVFVKSCFQYFIFDYFQAEVNPTAYLIYSIFTMLVVNGLIVYFVIVKAAGAYGYLLGETLAVVMIAVVSGFYLIRKLKFSWDFSVIGSILTFSLPLIPHYFFHWILGMSDRVLLDRYATLGQVGIYSLGYQIALFLQLFFTSINKAIVPSFSKASKDSHVLSRLPGLISSYFLIVSLMGVIFAVYSKPVVSLFFPREYQSVIHILPWLILGIVFVGYYFIPMNLITMTSGKTYLVPKYTFLAAAVNLSLNLIFIPKFGMVAAAVNTAIGYLLLFAFVLILSINIFPVTYQWNKILPIFIFSISLAGIGYFVLNYNPWINMLLATAILLLFIPAVKVFGFTEISELFGLVRKNIQ